jgi:DNA-binding transcriptional MerR regulator
MRTIALLALLATANAPGDAVVPIEKGMNMVKYQADYKLVRKDVIRSLDADSRNLKACEESLEKAQETLTSAKNDIQALQAAAQEQRAMIAELKAQKRVLENHITKLEKITCPEPTVGDQITETWENVDGMAGLVGGYAAGTGMCVALAWVFNQPDFTR